MKTKSNKTQGHVRKDTNGVPRITAKVVKMTPDQRKEWFDKSTTACNTTQKAEVQARLDLLNAGKYEIKSQGAKGTGQGRKIDFAAAFSKQTAAFLLTLKPELDKAIEAKRNEAMADIEAQEKELAARKAELATA